MSAQISTFPLVLAIRDDGSATKAIDNIARQIDQLANRRVASNADPLGLKAQLANLSTAPLQKAIAAQSAAENSLAQQRERARAENIAGTQRELDVALNGIRARQAAQAAAFQTAEAQGQALIKLDQQRIAEQAAASAALVAAPSQQPSIYYNPAGAQQAAAAARAQALALEQVAAAAHLAATANTEATATDRAFALTAREAATAAAQEATRLEALAATQARVAAAAVAASGKIEAATNRMSTLRKQTLVYTASDIVSSLGSGIDPFRILLQQGPQVAQVFALEEKGLRGLLSAFTPARLAVGGLTAAVAVGIVAWNNYSSALAKLNALSQGSGRLLGETGAQLEANAEAAARAANITVGSAREIEAGYLGVARSGDVLVGLTAFTKDFAAATGQDAKGAQQALIATFTDSAAGAQAMAEKYGVLTAAQIDHIAKLTEEGDLIGAQRELLHSLEGAFDGAAEHGNLLARAWNEIANAASGAWDWMGKALDRMAAASSIQDQIARATTKRDLVGQTDTAKAFYQKQIDDLRGQLAQAAAASKAPAIAAQAQANRITDAYTGANVLDGYRSNAGRLRQSLATDLPADQRRAQTEALNAYQHAIDTWLPKQEKANQLAALDAKIAATKAPAAKNALVAQRALVEAAGEVITATDAQALANSKGEKASIGAASAADAHARALQRQAEAFRQQQQAALDQVKRISSQFDEAPKLVDSAKLADGKLDEIIGKYGKLKDASSRAIAAAAEAAKKIVAAAPSNAIDLATKEMSRQKLVQDLIAAGHVAEAALLEDKLNLLQQIGVELGKEPESIKKTLAAYDAAAAARQAGQGNVAAANSTRELENQNAALRLQIAGRQELAELLQRQQQAEANGGKVDAAHLESLRQQLEANRQLGLQLDALNAKRRIELDYLNNTAGALRDATGAIARGDINGLLQTPGKLLAAYQQMQGDRLFEQIFGQSFRDLEDQINGGTGLKASADKFAGSVDHVTSSTDRLITASDRVVDAFGRVAGAPVSGSAGITHTVGGAPASNDLYSLLSKGNGSPPAVSLDGKTISRLDDNQRSALAKAIIRDLPSALQGASIGSQIGSIIGGKNGGSIGGGIGAVLGGLSSLVEGDQNSQTAKDIQKALGTISGDLQAYTIGAAIGTPLGNLIAGKGKRLSDVKTGGVVGGLVGGIAFGPVGAAIGAILGSIVGGIFAKTNRGGALVTSATGSNTIFGNDSATQANASTLGGAVQDGLSKIASSLGASLGSFAVSIGYFGDKIRVDTSGYTGSLDSKHAPALHGFATEEEAIRFAIVDAIKDGAIKGIHEGSIRLLEAGGDLDTALQKALSFEQVFKDLKARTDPVGYALDQVNSKFDTLRQTFAEAGASATELAQLEQLYGLERADALAQAQRQLTGTLQDLLDSLTYKGDTGLSLRTREAAARATFDPLAATVRAGGKVDQDAFSAAAQAYLDIERQLYGSSSTYFDKLAEITALTSKAIANAGGTVTQTAAEVAAAAQAAVPATTTAGTLAAATGTSVTTTASGLTVTAANDNASLAAAIVTAMQAQTAALKIPDDRAALFTAAQVTDALRQAFATPAPVGSNVVPIRTDPALVNALEQQIAVLEQQTATLSATLSNLLGAVNRNLGTLIEKDAQLENDRGYVAKAGNF